MSENEEKQKCLDEFQEFVDEQILEFEKEPYATHEFSTSEKYLAEKLLILLNANVEKLKKGMFFAQECETCRGYNHASPIHVGIIEKASIEEYSKLNRDFYILKEAHKKVTNSNNAVISIEALEKVISVFEEKVENFQNEEIYLELTLLLDEQKEVSKNLKKFI